MPRKMNAVYSNEHILRTFIRGRPRGGETKHAGPSLFSDRGAGKVGNRYVALRTLELLSNIWSACLIETHKYVSSQYSSLASVLPTAKKYLLRYSLGEDYTRFTKVTCPVQLKRKPSHCPKFTQKRYRGNDNRGCNFRTLARFLTRFIAFYFFKYNGDSFIFCTVCFLVSSDRILVGARYPVYAVFLIT